MARTRSKTARSQESGDRLDRESRPILDVKHLPKELRTKPPGGSPRKIFRQGHTREQVASRWHQVATAAVNKAKKVGLSRAVIKVLLKEEALAKSHRPHYLFEQAGRNRVIGGLGIGELLVSVSSGSIDVTAEAIRLNRTQAGDADFSTIDAIEPITKADVFSWNVRDDAYRTGAILTLFDFLHESVNEEAEAAFQRALAERHLSVHRTDFNRWTIREAKPDDLEALGSLPMVREISPNARLSVPSVKPSVAAPLVPMASPTSDHTYSVVGLLDTGVSPSALSLRPWIADQSNFIVLTPAAPHSDYSHATFIAALLVQAAAMNGSHPQMPSAPVKIHDVRVFSSAEGTTVDDLLARIGDAVADAPHVKVWNVSLGLTQPIQKTFSQFARDLDAIASKNGVLFIVAAGNYKEVPLRPWPTGTWPSGQIDLITPPADSPISLSVGAIAHKDDPASGVQNGDPAPYSRHGPGPAAIPKPELVHFGGSCSLARKLGGSLASICFQGTRKEGFGTSYAAPLVANLAARVWDNLKVNGYPPTPALVKAFLIHSAAVSNASDSSEVPYRGFGLPMDLEGALFCDEDEFTTLHTVHIPQGQQIHHRFAMPACLMADGKFRGEITVTLCYEPILDENNGTEYCRSNVSVALGTVETKDGKRVFHGRLPPEPSAPKDKLEKRLIEHGYKWSPTKVYRASFAKGIDAISWELRFEVLYRTGVVPSEPQLAHALVTVRALEPQMPVYRDGVRALAQASHTFNPVASRPRLRVTRRSS